METDPAPKITQLADDVVEADIDGQTIYLGDPDSLTLLGQLHDPPMVRVELPPEWGKEVSGD